MGVITKIDGEEWMPIAIKNESSYYSISNMGRIKSNYSGVEKLRVFSDNGHGYSGISLSHFGKKYQNKVHRLVALNFIPNPENLPEVCHIDHDKKNNNVSNLRWGTKADNAGESALAGKLSRGSRKLPPIKVGKYFAGVCLKTYPSMGRASLDGYARVSLSRRLNSEKPYKGFHWKSIID